MDKLRIVSYINEPFRNRKEAGSLLARELRELKEKEALILGIPRGGVVIAAELAKFLNADLDILLSRKIGAPSNPELAIGAVTEDGKVFLNDVLAFQVNVDMGYIEKQKSRQLNEINNRLKIYRKAHQKVNVRAREVVVTDDGIATGATMQAALMALRQEKPAGLTAAIPVCAKESAKKLTEYADKVLVLRSPDYLGAISQFYLDFSQVSDDKVIKILKEAHTFKKDEKRALGKSN
ncbi:MAG: phosphoribosyltransferase family protein [Candidatus Omnitrophota bacterium]